MVVASPLEILDPPIRFSQSMFWTLEKNLFEESGPEAWTKLGVPFYLTSNPHIAESYAQLIMGFIRDSKKLNGQPLYILELGAGLGRFSYYFLKAFLQLLDDFHLSNLPFCYVLSDIAEKNIVFWKEHPKLAPFFERGILDAALYNPLEDDKIELIFSNKKLDKNSIINPLVVIANYFFDSIPHDLFRVQDGQIEEGLVSVHGPKNLKSLSAIQLEYSWRPIKNLSTYHPSLSNYSHLLSHYQHSLQDQPFHIPTSGLHCIERLLSISQNNLLLISSDKGLASCELLKSDLKLEPASHGAYSAQVNFHAFKEYFHSTQMHFQSPRSPSPIFTTILQAFAKSSLDLSETTNAFDREFNFFSPLDSWELINQLAIECPQPSLELILKSMKLSRFDPSVLYVFMKPLQALASNCIENAKAKIGSMLDLCLENYFFTSPQEGSLICNIGLIYFQMNELEKALNIYDYALQINPTDCSTLLSKSLCLQKMGCFEKSMQCLIQITLIDPTFTSKLQTQMDLTQKQQ